MQPSVDSSQLDYTAAPFTATLVQALGIVVLAATPIGVLTVLAMRLDGEESLSGFFVAVLVAGFVAGATVGGLLLGLALLIRYASALTSTTIPVHRHRSDVEHAGPMAESIAQVEADQAGTTHLADTEQMLTLLQEIRDLLLLEPEERDQTRERTQTNQLRHAAEELVDVINLRQLGKARAMLCDAEARFGSAAMLERLAQKIEHASAQHESLDYAHTRRLVEDAVRIGRWALAETYLRALHLNHPHSARCRRLWDDTRRARLHAHLLQCVKEHHWEEALAATEEFLERFPGSPEAEGLRGQVDTLKANAEIQTRKTYETKFKELIHAQRYGEALRLARHVIGQYPSSPQAAALRTQIPAIEKRIPG